MKHRRVQFLLLIVSVCAIGCMLLFVAPKVTAQTGEAEEKTSIFRGLDADEMFIGGFIGPRAAYYRKGQLIYEGLKDDEVFKLIKEAGFNYICDNDFSYSGAMQEDAKKALQYAQDNDLMYLMPAYDIMKVDGEIMASDREIAAKLQEMYQYDSFGGLFLRDEPTSDMFPFIKKCLDKLNAIQNELGYTDLNVYLNLLLYLSPEWLSNGTDSTMTWPKYIRSLSATGVEYLSFDMYPIQGAAPAVSTTWFRYLGMMNEAALEVGKPWMGYAQVGGSTPSYPYEVRVTTEGELRWDIHTMLAFGAKGINYYILVSPPYFANAGVSELNTHSIINVYGEKTAYWYMAKEINSQIQSMDHILMNCKHEGVIIAGKSPCEYDGKDRLKTYRGLKAVSGNALIGCFDYKGETALLVVNNDFTADNEIILSFDKLYSCQVIQDCMERDEYVSELKLQISAGDCALVVLKGSHISFDLNCITPEKAPTSIEICDNTYGILPMPLNRPGYRFAGWYTDSSTKGDPVLPTDEVTQSQTLYAKWLYMQDTVLIRAGSDACTISKVFYQGRVYWEYRANVNQLTIEPLRQSLEFYWQDDATSLQVHIKVDHAADENGQLVSISPKVLGRNANFELIEVDHTFTDENGREVHLLESGGSYILTSDTDDASCLLILPQVLDTPYNLQMRIQDPEFEVNHESVYTQRQINLIDLYWIWIPMSVTMVAVIVLFIKKRKK